jgi:nicotinamidase/pyrazinamidase
VIFIAATNDHHAAIQQRRELTLQVADGDTLATAHSVGVVTDEQFETTTLAPKGGRADGADEGLSSALVVVDMQNDFGHPDGSLFVNDAPAIVDLVNEQIERVASAGGTVVLTQDWHPASTPHFIDDGGVWPTHCVAGTWGAAIIDGVDPNHRASSLVRKGTNGEDGYSAFAMREPGGTVDIPTGLAGLLRERGITRVIVCGLATDVCVAATGLSAAVAGFETVVLLDASRPVSADADTAARVVHELETAGITLA